jgi:predicted double-glycine peptidase
MKGYGLAMLVACLFATVRLPTADDHPTPKEGRLIPPSAIRIPLPDVRQPDGYTCGASALMSICAYYGVGPRTIDEFKKALGSNPESGTNYREMVRFARSLGLDAQAEVGWTPDRLEAAVTKGHPVIVAIQAYADDPRVYQDSRKNDDGHYVVVIGFDEKNYYMEDPSLERCRGLLPKAEFLRRWHDDEGTAGNPKIVVRLGLEFGPGQTGGPCLERAQRID